MTNTQQLLAMMEQGRVYRRQELEGFSSAVDRDLKSLVDSGNVQKLASGLYYRPRVNAFGEAPPDPKELVRAFLKTDDFLLTSHNHFTELGLGLTQVYNTYVVYNHKRSGEFQLGRKRFQFRLVPAYPASLSKEYLLVDLLNNLAKLPDNTEAVLRNLRAALAGFDRAKVNECLELYGRARARRTLAACA